MSILRAQKSESRNEGTSLYTRQPGVPPVRIGAYPKRRPSWVKAPVIEAEGLLSRGSSAEPAPRILTEPVREPSYADFLRVPQQQQASSAA